MADSSENCFKIPQRWVTVFMGFLGLFNAFTMRSCLSIAIIEMTVHHKMKLDNKLDNPDIESNRLNSTALEVTEHSNILKYDWDEETQGLILSSFYWGYMPSSLLGGPITQKYGGKHTLGVGILLTSLLTLMIPQCVYWGGSTSLIILRVAMGFGEGTTYPAVTDLLGHWIPEDERSKAGSLVFSGTIIGSMFGVVPAGFILQHSKSGWPMVFYFYGTIGVVFFLLNSAFCFSRPADNPYISTKELTYLESKLDKIQIDLPATPWRYVLKSTAVWALNIAKFGFSWGYLTVVSDMPKYLSSVLNFSAQNIGNLSFVQFIMTMVICCIGSWMADSAIEKKVMSVTNVRKIAGTAGLLGPSIFLIASSYAGCEVFFVIVLQSIGMALLGCCLFSFTVNSLDLSPNYGSSIMGLGNGIAVLSGAIAPYIVGVLTPNQTIEEWRIVFWIMGISFIVPNLIYVVYGSGDVQKWNDPAFFKKSTNKNVDKVEEGVELLVMKK